MLNIQPGQKAKVKKAELKFSQSGGAICTFSLYTSTKKRGATGDKKDDWDTHWFNGIAFKDTAEFISKLADGTRIEIKSGAIQQEKWTDKEGNAKQGYKVLVFDAALAESVTSSHQQAAPTDDEAF